MVGDHVYDIIQTGPVPLILDEDWSTAKKGLRIKIADGSTLSLIYCGCVAANYYMKADDTKNPKAKRSQLAKREFEGKQPLFPKGGINFSVYGSVLAWSAHETELFAGFTEGSLCDQYHPTLAGEVVPESDKPPDAMS